jgi:hypothetical protein
MARVRQSRIRGIEVMLFKIKNHPHGHAGGFSKVADLP